MSWSHSQSAAGISASVMRTIRNQAFAQPLLLGTHIVDAGLQIADFVAALLDLRQALGLREPLLHRADGVFRVGAGKVVHRRLGIDLGPCEFLHPLPYAAKPQFERVGHFALPYQRIAKPQRGGDERERDQDDYEPSQLMQRRLGAKGL